MKPFYEAEIASEEYKTQFKEKFRADLKAKPELRSQMFPGLDPESEMFSRVLDETIEDIFSERVVINEDYQVAIRVIPAKENWPALIHLSIKRLDRSPIHDWRELQEIKNAICGVEAEAVELYPAESRRVDSANQYHLWVLLDNLVFPFGFSNRIVTEESIAGSQQRSLGKG